jgi:hypothetical protein
MDLLRRVLRRPTDRPADAIVGGLYSHATQDGFGVLKVLAVDAIAVHRAGKPRLITVVPVMDDDLEAYREWSDAGGGVFD